jgi:uncharacterized protein YwgA
LEDFSGSFGRPPGTREGHGRSPPGLPALSRTSGRPTAPRVDNPERIDPLRTTGLEGFWGVRRARCPFSTRVPRWASFSPAPHLGLNIQRLFSIVDLPVVSAEVRWLIGYLGLTPERVRSPLGFNARLRVQKAALLLKHMSVRPFTGFEFGIYLRGPYSSQLSSVYYNLGDSPAREPSMDSATKEALRWFASNDLTWLEVASSILSIKDSHPSMSRSEVLSQLRLSKPWVTGRFFERVYSDLSGRNLLS